MDGGMAATVNIRADDLYERLGVTRQTATNVARPFDRLPENVRPRHVVTAISDPDPFDRMIGGLGACDLHRSFAVAEVFL